MHPFLGVTLFQIRLKGPVNGLFGIDRLLDALPAHLGQPQLKRLRFGRRDGLDDTQKLLRVGNVGETFFAIGGGHFQLLTICKQFICTLAGQTIF